MTASLIAHSRPWITDEDTQAVTRQLQSGMIGQGAVCRVLERRMARWIQAEDGVSAGSGTAAIVLALRALEIKPDDEVLLPTYVCVSLYEAILTVGAKPVLCDVGHDWVMTAETAARALTAKTRAILVPHIYGIFADVLSIRALGIPVIEDLAQAVDAESARALDADIAVFSFHPTKCLTAGEGGVAVSSDLGLVEKMRLFRDGGGTELSGRLFSPLSDLSASLALSQLARFPQMLEKRRSLALRYHSVLQKACPEILNASMLDKSMFFRFPVLVEGGLSAFEHQFLERGVIVRQGVDKLLHRLLHQDDQGFSSAVNLFRKTVSLPIYPALTAEEEKRCIHAASEVFAGS